MGTFVFKWPHPAEEVYVTGTFDGWSKSEQLVKVRDGFEKKVTLSDSSQKIYYKFVVDHEWITDHEAPREKDHEGNENNFLLPSQIMATKQEAGPGAAAISSAAPESTTAQLAGAIPLEETKDNLTAPGGYPETPAADANKEFKISPLPATEGALNPIKLEPGQEVPEGITTGNMNSNVTLDKESYEKSGAEKEFKVSPLPATEGALNPIKLEPGQKVPEGITTGNINSNVTLDKESYENSGAEKEFKVSPLPATEGALNPIKLEPGQKIPEGIAAGNTNSNVTLDKESYEKSDRIPGLDTELPPISNTMIPESSLPILGGDVVAFSSAAPNSTTAALAGAVPLEEPKVPEIVKESQEKAQVDPEASGISEEVKEKAAVEDELLQKVSEAPSTSEGTSGKGTEKSETDKTIAETVATAAATAGAAVLGAALAAKQTATDTATDVAASLPGLQESVKQALPVSIQDAIGATKKETAPETISSEVPAEVKESIEKSGESPEAAASTAAVEEKKEVEAELLKQVEVAPVTSESSTQPAEVKLADTKPEASKIGELKPEDAKPVEIQPAEVKPEAPKEEPVQVDAVKPTTNGAGTTTTKTSETTPQPAVSAPAEGVAASSSKPTDVAASSEKKKKNRLSAIFSKLRHKVSSKDKA